MKLTAIQTAFIAIALLLSGCKEHEDAVENLNNSNEATTAVDPIHNSQNALDYYGTYTGVLPCADCTGIKTSLTLLENDKFMRSIQYLGKEKQPTVQKGTYKWNKAGSAITIQTSPGQMQQYKVGENVLWHLDQEGNRINGTLASRYRLEKQLQ